MDKGFEPWFQDQQINWQPTNPNSFTAPYRLNAPPLGNMFLPNATSGDQSNPSAFAFGASKPEEPCGWFYGNGPCRFGAECFAPMVNSIPKEQLPVLGSTHEAQKKFLVFDQSNDRTTLIYASTPVQYDHPKPQFTFDLKKETGVIKKHEEDIHLSNGFCEDVGSEMREDTEELRALLYSESDYSEEEEEEQSTGHSPEWPDEEVASSLGPRKRHKLISGGFDVVSLEDTASSGVNWSGLGNSSGLLHKRSRKEKVRETISILQQLIPGGKDGKDAIMILDEAINYLRVLKVKAKAMGL